MAQRRRRSPVGSGPAGRGRRPLASALLGAAAVASAPLLRSGLAAAAWVPAAAPPEAGLRGRGGPRRAAAGGAGGGAWGEALEAQRERAGALLGQLAELEQKLGGAARAGAEAAAVRAACEEGSADDQAFERLSAANTALQAVLIELEAVARLPPVVDERPISLPQGSRLAGLDVPVDVLPPVGDFSDWALVPGAAHVRVTLPLDDNQAVLWGSDLTPYFDAGGERLMVFIAEMPLGMQIGTAERPPEAPAVSNLNAIVVEAVGERSEAERLGIRPGDFVRAVSRMGPGLEPSFFDKMLGAEPVRVKDVVKVDGLSADEVSMAMLSNRDGPDGKLTLLLERPP
ncbi:unnamed protein product [Prorocentrum cordatum]|uniref:PDZ domain-containing protein n=1 Tax=Prorocentrum cordatum TaxID=2364126 RepID=A0ABN9VTX8_9DINO|nr:unnamed protein product [Polarella glacialis]